jgi:hypothetical protein
MILRSASSSYKGYTYQRARLLNLLFCSYYSSVDEELKSTYFKEEELEDIDIYKININNEEIILYQEKYLNGNDDESLNINSGLTKVLISHYNNDKITKINYEVISTSGNIKPSNKLYNFLKLINDNDNNYLIGKFIALNYCNGYLFSKISNYDIFINKIKNEINITNLNDIINKKITNKDDKKSEKSTNLKNLNIFCHYCINDDNISHLLIYLKKINFCIQHKTFNDIHNETINKLKCILPEFNNLCNIMSDEYNNFYCETLYAVFDMIIVENLFKDNEKVSIYSLIQTVKNKYKNGITDNDKINIIINTIEYFNSQNKYDDLKKILFKDYSFTNYLLKNKISITKFIKLLKKKDKNIVDLIRNIVYQICLIKKYNFLDDKKVLCFLYRSHNNLKFTGNSYRSIRNIDNLII